jgi:hypothetical protein
LLKIFPIQFVVRAFRYNLPSPTQGALGSATVLSPAALAFVEGDTPLYI